MINIYESKETNFTHNGLGVLSPSSAIIYEVLNGEYSLTLTHPIDRHNKWSLLEEDRIIKANGQLFRIYKVKKSVENKEIEVYALHIFYDLSKNFIEDTNIVSKSGVQALRQILNSLSFDTNFTCDSDITKVESARLVRKNVTQSLIGDDDNSFVNRWGGEIKRDNFHFDFNVQIGESKGTKISYGKNLIGLTATIDMSSVATRIVPIAFDGITLPEKYIDSEYISNYSNPIIRVVEFDDVKYAESPNNSSGDGYKTLSEVYAELRRRANLMFSDEHVDIPTSNFEVDFVELSKTEQYKKYKDLETINLGDVVKVEHKQLNIDFTVRVISYKYNCLYDRYDSIELGQKNDTIFTSINEIKKNESITLGTITDLVNVSKSEAISKATELIQNGLGGYVIKTNDELIIADNPDLNLAVNVWRWNVNGLGFSSTGYNGTYGLALTNDGQIVADAITAGELNGEIIKANTLKTNALEVEAVRKIEMAQSEEQVKTLITAGLGEFEVTVNDKITKELEGYYTKEETMSQISQNAESIALSVTDNKIQSLQLGGANLLLNSDTKKQLDKAESGSYNHISYNLVDDYKGLTLNNDTTFVLSFTADRTSNFDLEGFDSITFDNGWYYRWFRDDLDKLTYVKDHTFKFVMKPKTLPKGTILSDKLSFIAENEYGGALIYNVMLVEGDKAFDWQPSSNDVSNSIAQIEAKAGEISLSVAKNEINNLQIGGANLYNNTCEIAGFGGVSNIIRTETGFSFLGVVTNDGTLRVFNLIKSAGWYTISFMVKTNVQYWDMNVEINDAYVGTVVAPSDHYRYVSFSYYVGENNYNDHYNFVDFEGLSAQTYDIKNFKVEKGQKATDYTPSFTDITNSIARIDVKADEINSTVNGVKQNISDNYSTTSQMNSAINQKANEITSTVSTTYATKTDLNTTNSNVSTNSSSITQLSNQISTKVDANGVKSIIQQNPESVRIGFNAISNYFDLNSSRLQVGHSDGSYTQIGQDGVVYYANGSGHRYHNLMYQGWLGIITGTTWSRTITLPDEFKGKTFSVIISITEVEAVNTNDVIKHFKITVPQKTVDYANAKFVINGSALAYYVVNQESATAIEMDVSWIAIA